MIETLPRAALGSRMETKVYCEIAQHKSAAIIPFDHSKHRYTLPQKISAVRVGVLIRLLLTTAHMSYEAWVTILLAALGVLLAAITLVVALAGLGIAIVGIWGIKGIKVAAQKKANEAVEAKIGEYPQAEDFLELYRNLQTRLDDFQAEYDLFKRRNDEANGIIARLSSLGGSGASKGSEDTPQPTNGGTEAITATYPGEREGQHGGNDGNA